VIGVPAYCTFGGSVGQVGRIDQLLTASSMSWLGENNVS